MRKLVAILALYAAVGVTVLLVKQSEKTPETGSPDTQSASDEGRYEDLRAVMTEARRQARAEVKAVVKDVDLRLARIESLRKSMDEGIAATQVAAEGAAQGGYGRLQELERDMRGVITDVTRLKALSRRFATLQREVKEFEARITSLEERPVHVAPPPTDGAGGVKPKPPTEPEPPDLRLEPPKSPEQIREEIERARKDILSQDLDILFPAIEKIREHRVFDAVPRLIEILSSFKDEFGRTAAAAALGRMEVCDAVPALAEAMKDKSNLVSQQANKAVTQITKMDSQLSPSARAREKRSASGRVKEWWRDHEGEVRARLGQPKK